MKEIDLKCPDEVLEKWKKVVERTAIEILDNRLFKIEYALHEIEKELEKVSGNIYNFIITVEDLKKHLDELKEVLGFKKEEK